MNTHCIPSKIVCPIPGKVRPGRIEADLSGGEMASDGGVVLTSAIAGQLILFGRAAGCLDRRRSPKHVVRSLAGKSTLNRLELLAAACDAERHRKVQADFAHQAVFLHARRNKNPESRSQKHGEFLFGG